MRLMPRTHPVMIRIRKDPERALKPMNAPYCSRLSLEAGESLAGTADPVDVWLMLEYRGAWNAQATTDNTLSESAQAWITSLLDSHRARGRKVRLQFIRQQTGGGVRLFTIDGSTTWLRSAPDHDALAAAEDVAVSGRLYFVCTHGTRDRCCAEFGMPVYRALREKLGNRVWQTSHLGGHRYAANVLVTPDAVMYGRLTPEDVDQFVSEAESGLTPARFTRGRTCHEAPVQAAEVLLGMRLDQPSIVQSGARSWEISASGRTVKIAALESSGVASCGDSKLKTTLQYFLVD